MELASLKGKLSTANRGHKLLKDKQDELMRQFILLIRKNNELRAEVETKLTKAMQSFVMAKALLNEKFIEELVAIPPRSVSLNLHEKNIMSVKVPVMNFNYTDNGKSDELSYGYLNSNSELDTSIEQMADVMTQLLELSEIEKTCQLMLIGYSQRKTSQLVY